MSGCTEAQSEDYFMNNFVVWNVSKETAIS
jgi:hypothetical protein